MKTLAKQLDGFYRVARGGEVPEGLLDVTSQARVGAYQRNHLLNRVEALKASYPILLQLVGEPFFEAMAAAYVKATPAVSANLHDDGADFDRWVGQFPPAAHLPYLPDVARLEWALHRAYYAPDVSLFDPARLAEVPPDAVGQLCFRFTPATRLLTSAWPLFDIWAYHQPGQTESPPVNLAQGGGAVLVCRTSDGCMPQVLTASDASAIEAMLAGATFAEAVDAAVALDDAFTPGPLLARLLSWQALHDIRLAEGVHS
ncbi:HvfC/BufC N-terminal domain-containing protein [Leeia oryzae]|uniref:HvfC/BufC N-terminal domain-containing protein n=1 Tax=Leeia oryzae TaxID=356662 RepID=UPI00037F7CD6|nr:DNA-binding domain-containing protein [Leeia oryzae]